MKFINATMGKIDAYRATCFVSDLVLQESFWAKLNVSLASSNCRLRLELQ